MTNRAVSKWENGKSFPDVGLLEDLGRELDVSVGELLAGKRIEAEHYQDGDGEDAGGGSGKPKTLRV